MKKFINLFSVLALVAGSLLFSGCGLNVSFTLHSNYPEELGIEKEDTCVINLSSVSVETGVQNDFSTFLNTVLMTKLKDYVNDEKTSYKCTRFNNQKDGKGSIDISMESDLTKTLLLTLLENPTDFYAIWTKTTTQTASSGEE